MAWYLLFLVPMLAMAMPYPTGVTLPGGIGSAGTFVFGFRPDGITKRPISTVYMAIESSPGADGCYFSYWPQWGIFLADRTGNAVGPLAPGSSGSLENASCRLSGAGSYASVGVDGELSVGLSVTFKTAMPAGTKPLWSAALDGVASSGWVANLGGVYCVRECSATNQVPIVQPLTPEQRTGTVENFTFDFADGDGSGDISNGLVLINGGLDRRDACLLSIDPLADYGRGVAYFVTDRGPSQAVTVDTLFPGNAATVGRNEQCEVQGGSLRIVKFSTTVRVSMSIRMKGAGTKQIYMAALDQRGGNSSWVNRGAWIAPAIAPAQPDQYDPGCANAWTCTTVVGLYQPRVDRSRFPQLALEVGPVTLTNAWLGLSPTTETRYSDFRVFAVKYANGCPAGHTIGPYSSPSYPGVPVGAVHTQTTVNQKDWLKTEVIRRNLSERGFGPGYYYFRMEATINGTRSGQAGTPSVRFWHTGCIEAGFAPQIDGLRDNVSGLPQIERGAETGYVEVYGTVNGTSSTSISPNQGVAPWQISGVYPQSNQVNVSYAVDRSATTGRREIKLYNGLWSPPWPLYVVDPEPQITSMVPDRPWQPGET
ncbi:MAG: hypothetical protein K7J47_22590, partial [Acidobacteria bacterium]|nr:hypothetical protein [Bryobacteraceae bacterium CoA2 C42]